MSHDREGLTERSWHMLAWLALAEFLAMTMWFSATAVAGGLKSEFRMTDGQAAWLTMAVQAGFVIGALVTAILNLSDIINPRRWFRHRLRPRRDGERSRDAAGSATAAIALAHSPPAPRWPGSIRRA